MFYSLFGKGTGTYYMFIYEVCKFLWEGYKGNPFFV